MQAGRASRPRPRCRAPPRLHQLDAGRRELELAGELGQHHELGRRSRRATARSGTRSTPRGPRGGRGRPHPRRGGSAGRRPGPSRRRRASGFRAGVADHGRGRGPGRHAHLHVASERHRRAALEFAPLPSAPRTLIACARPSRRGRGPGCRRSAAVIRHHHPRQRPAGRLGPGDREGVLAGLHVLAGELHRPSTPARRA